MQGDSDKDVFDFLAGKILTGDRKKQKEALFFWAGLIASDFERNFATAGLDSEDKTYIQEAVETWFHGTLLKIIFELNESGKDPETARLRIQKAVTARVRNIIKDLLFERKTRRGNREKGRDSDELSIRNSRMGLGMSHMSPEVQDTVFLDASADAETQFLYREILLKQNQVRPDTTGLAITNRSGEAIVDAHEDIMGFLARQTYLEALQAKLANTKHISGNKG